MQGTEKRPLVGGRVGWYTWLPKKKKKKKTKKKKKKRRRKRRLGREEAEGEGEERKQKIYPQVRLRVTRDTYSQLGII
jgi:hypothetical protein